MRSVAKHGYLKGRIGRQKAKAHVDYIQHREGADRERGPRPLFDKDRENLGGHEAKNEIQQQQLNGVIAHKLILSPGMNGADLKEYTREVMEELSRAKGLDLSWYAVEHKNTRHDHVHVVVMGKDENGKQVRLGRDDYKIVKEASDRYLEREYYLERFLDREMETLLERGVRGKTPEYKRDKGDDRFEQLIKGSAKERDRKEEKKVYDDREQEPRGPGLERGKGRQQWMYEGRGRLSDAHDYYMKGQEQARQREIESRKPADLGKAAERELSEISKFEQGANLESRPRNDGIDRLLGQSTERTRGQEDRSERSETKETPRPRGDDDERKGRGSRGDR
ncbi:MAG: hypothetical protein K2X81_17885 [Candidatus Obscuribacterales bacterium]|nr:hypothetical protein [Candidatus Obscuribacterales bacterium]